MSSQLSELVWAVLRFDGIELERVDWDTAWVRANILTAHGVSCEVVTQTVAERVKADEPCGDI